MGTETGRLICLETDDAGDDGWLMWGADAAQDGRRVLLKAPGKYQLEKMRLPALCETTNVLLVLRE